MNSVYMYHSKFWKHLKRIAAANPSMDAGVAEKILNFNPYDKEHDLLFWLPRISVGSGGIDRTGKLNNFKSDYVPIPTDISNFNKSFADVCLDEAQKLWKDNDFIDLLWSGGIDSTAVAVALLKTKPETKKLQLTCTSFSIIEYPEFYETHKDICNVLSVEEFFSKERVQSNHLIVTGDVGDQIWGSRQGFREEQNTSWEIMLDRENLFRQTTLQYPEIKEPWTQEQKNKLADILNDHATACPVEIKTVFDMSWWIKFSIKMNYVKFRTQMVIAYNHNLDYVNLNNFKPFFLTDDFQRWSLTDYSNRVATSETTYKQPAKDFIFSYTKDADYRNNKTKEASLPKMLTANNWFGRYHHDENANYAVMSNGTIYSTRNDMPVSVIEDIMGKN